MQEQTSAFFDFAVNHLYYLVPASMGAFIFSRPGYYIFISMGAFLFSLLGTRLMILALRRNPLFIDRPNQRSNHTAPTPRGGGVAVVFSLIVFLLAADASYWLIIGLALIATVSLLDDMITLSPITRLLVQLFCVLIVQEDAQFVLFGDLIPAWLDYLLVVGCWVWFINLFNFMDGIDGIAAAEVISIGIGICLITAATGMFGNQLSIFALLMVAAGSGFLWWNWHPAKIFLGDVGSISLGLLLGYLLFSSMQGGTIIKDMRYVYPALILPAYYLTDSTLTLLKRLWRGEKIWQAHSQHYYQRAVRNGRSHRLVVENILGVNILLICLTVFTLIMPELALFDLFVAYAMVGALMHNFTRPPRHALRK